MKLLWSTLPLLLICFLLPDVLEAKKTKWSRLLTEKTQRTTKRKLNDDKGGIRGEKKDPEETSSGKGSKKKLAKKDKCNRDRKSVSFTTVFNPDDLNTIAGSSVVGTEFGFGGDYSGNWTQTQIEVTDQIILGHDHLTFFDDDGEVIGALTTQFDGSVDFAIVTAGYGEFACAHGSPVIEFPEDTPMVHVVWDLCVCYD